MLFVFRLNQVTVRKILNGELQFSKIVNKFCVCMKNDVYLARKCVSRKKRILCSLTLKKLKVLVQLNFV